MRIEEGAKEACFGLLIRNPQSVFPAFRNDLGIAPALLSPSHNAELLGLDFFRHDKGLAVIALQVTISFLIVNELFASAIKPKFAPFTVRDIT